MFTAADRLIYRSGERACQWKILEMALVRDALPGLLSGAACSLGTAHGPGTPRDGPANQDPLLTQHGTLLLPGVPHSTTQHRATAQHRATTQHRATSTSKQPLRVSVGGRGKGEPALKSKVVPHSPDILG